MIDILLNIFLQGACVICVGALGSLGQEKKKTNKANPKVTKIVAKENGPKVFTKETESGTSTSTTTIEPLVIHTIQPGDTIEGIMLKYSVSVRLFSFFPLLLSLKTFDQDCLSLPLFSVLTFSLWHDRLMADNGKQRDALCKSNGVRNKESLMILDTIIIPTNTLAMAC